MAEPLHVVDQETRPPESQGGVTSTSVREFAQRARAFKAEMDEVRGEQGALYKDFEERGGHRRALKEAVKLTGMEIAKGQDYWRSLNEYLQVLGFFAQGDLIDPLPGDGGSANVEPDAAGNETPSGESGDAIGFDDPADTESASA